MAESNETLTESDVIFWIIDQGSVTDEDIGRYATEHNENLKDIVIDLMNGVEDRILIKEESEDGTIWKSVWSYFDEKTRICPRCGHSLNLVRIDGLNEYRKVCRPSTHWVLRCNNGCTFDQGTDAISVIEGWDSESVADRVVRTLAEMGWDAHGINQNFTDKELSSVIDCISHSNNTWVQAINAICILLLKHCGASETVMNSYHLNVEDRLGHIS